MSLIHISSLAFRHDGAAEDVFSSLSLHLDTTWKLGLIGRNGRGKTTLLRLLANELDHGGAISTSVTCRYFPFPVPDPTLPVSQIMTEICPTARDPADVWKLERELSLLGMPSEILFRPFSTLSGGERVKTLLAALFLLPDAFLLIDEPTSHLDMTSRQTVATYLREKQGFIMVSHDRRFLDGAVDHILSLNRSGLEIQQGDYSRWKLNRDRQDAYEYARMAKLKRDAARLEDARKRPPTGRSGRKKASLNRVTARSREALRG